MKITRHKSGMLTYIYEAGPGIGFRFHLLCEVGRPYQKAAQAIIRRKGWTVTTREIPAAPWVADFAQ